MGIRFFCPNGHRLNVKSFLAGKRGVCPDCGIGVDIPMESDTRASGKRKLLGSIDPAANNDSATAVLERPDPAPAHDDFGLPASLQLPPTASATSPVTVVTPNFAFETVLPEPVPAPVMLPAAAAPVMPTPISVAPVASTVSVVPVMPSPVMPSPVATPVPAFSVASLPVVTALGGAAVATPVVAQPAPANDAIAEAPMAIWYVRPPAGGQYGPARGDVMRKWLAEGRVTNDSLVWREGWPDWRPATKVFPQLASPAAEAGPVIAETPRRPIRPLRKSSTATGIAIVIGLGVVCVGLFVALIYVLMNSEPPPAP